MSKPDPRALALEALSAGIPDRPEVVRLWRAWDTDTLQDELRWLLKEGNEAALVSFATYPRAREILIRQCAVATEDRHHQLAAWIAVLTRSDLLVPLLRLERLRDEGDFGSDDVGAMTLDELLSRSSYSAVELLDRSSHGMPDEGVHTLYASMTMRRLPPPPYLDEVLDCLSCVEAALSATG